MICRKQYKLERLAAVRGGFLTNDYNFYCNVRKYILKTVNCYTRGLDTHIFLKLNNCFDIYFFSVDR